MRTTTTKFVRKPLAAAVMCSAIGLSPAVLAATIENVNTNNLSVPPVEGKTLVYTDTAGTATFGWFDPVNDSGDIGLGMSVYNEIFSAAGETFQGCIMAQTDLESDPEAPQAQQDSPNCLAPGDSGKRFKLKTTETNGPIDLVFDVTADEASKLYRVIGKFSNLTDGTNSVDGILKALRFETGFGVGNEFMPSSAEDGLSFGMEADGQSKISAGNLGKFPGGLFGGSKVEGLPFFSTSVAEFIESTDTVSVQDKLETNGEIPTPYTDLVGADSGWLALANVPTGWFIDHDGNPSNDSILLAYDDPETAEEDWMTNEKVFQAAVGDWDGKVTYEFDHDNDQTTDPILVDIDAVNWDPNGDSFADPVTVTVDVDNGDGTTTPTDFTTQDYVKDVSPLVETLGEGDPEDAVVDAVILEPKEASALYVADYDTTDDVTEGFYVLIDGEAVEIAPFGDWDTTPVTVIDSTNSDALFATWNPDPDPTVEGEEGIYEVDGAYVGTTVTINAEEVVVPETFTLDEMIAISGPPDSDTATLIRQPGYVQGPIEDLANVNINTSVAVSGTSTWPTCTGDGTETSCTFTLRVTGLNDAVEVPTIPVTPVEPTPEPEPEEPAASSSDGDGTIFGCTAGKPGSPFDPVLPSMVLAALAGLWARKRRGTA
ncbi:choice-of-anchor F family protein [Marinobacter pelagius]|uniref:Uncharacterized protein n=1 Tax=Marinobacter pelagius TaxID=379482 RepID=A0A1I4W813_9GAMM|nr:choice-of-anchor F family protein [Marinobacter pelagius]SFN09346.1 hypothetical protein SAMN04487961_2126 [Marinobacter pelagius]